LFYLCNLFAQYYVGALAVLQFFAHRCVRGVSTTLSGRQL
jgi:hypothetical protein